MGLNKIDLQKYITVDPVSIDILVLYKSVYKGYWNAFIHSAISTAPLQVLYYSEALPTTARILFRSFTPKRTGNCR